MTKRHAKRKGPKFRVGQVVRIAWLNSERPQFDKIEKSLRLALDAYVQERVDQQMRELEHAALDVIEWENEYRTLNNLGKYPPSPFVRLAICASKRAKT